jgi:hypothetical protein
MKLLTKSEITYFSNDNLLSSKICVLVNSGEAVVLLVKVSKFQNEFMKDFCPEFGTIQFFVHILGETMTS